MKWLMLLIFISFAMPGWARTADLKMQPDSSISPIDLGSVRENITKVYLNKAGHAENDPTYGCNAAVIEYKGSEEGQLCRMFIFSGESGGYENIYQQLSGDDPDCSQADLMMQSKISESPFSVTATERMHLVNGMGDTDPSDEEYNQIALVMNDDQATWTYSTQSASRHDGPWGMTCVFDK